MPLPPPQPRDHLHTRTAVYRGYRRADGLWDIDAEMTDIKTHPFEQYERGTVPPGTPAHGMAIRLTVDDELVIREIATSMDYTPMDHCQQANDPMQKMIGVKLGAGWRKAIDEALGRNKGCTHLRELLFNMATAGVQAISGLRMQWGGKGHGAAPDPDARPPFHLGQCINWDFDGPSVARYHPEFAGWRPLERAAKP